MTYKKPVIRKVLIEKKPVYNDNMADSGCGMCKVFKKS